MRKAPRTSSLLYLHLFSTTFLILIVQSCLTGRGIDDHGEALGVQRRVAWKMTAPANMVFIPGGSFMSSPVDQDLFSIFFNKQVSVSSFYMDETEVTNNIYRQFIDYLLAAASDTNQQQAETSEDEEDFLEDDNAEEASSVERKVTAKKVNTEGTNVLSEAFIMDHLYPDMSVWQKDFSHHMADHMLDYYEHEGFDQFPVVGITWEAAREYASWRTKYLNDYRAEKGLPKMPQFRLPTAAEWEYAARGGKELAKYPWGGPYVRDAEGKLLANFKSSPGNYGESKYDYTSPVRHFPPNDYGLYDMAGNVAEWTLDDYNPATVARVWSLNPIFLDENHRLKIIKGGSWNTISRFLQTGANDYADKEQASSYIGFRCVMSHIGEE